MHLKNEEKELLWKKYRKLGLAPDQAKIRLNDFVTSLNNLVDKLKAQNKPKDYINERFRKEFEEMCMKIDGMQ